MYTSALVDHLDSEDHAHEASCEEGNAQRAGPYELELLQGIAPMQLPCRHQAPVTTRNLQPL